VIDSLGISNWTGDSKSPVQYTSPKLENVQKNNYQIFLSSCNRFLRLWTKLIKNVRRHQSLKLLTMDKDFTHLDKVFLELEIIEL
jgi:hypothetical protein